MDLGIVNGRVYLNGEFLEENVYVKNGRIEAITKSYLPCKTEYNAKGKLVLPGFIDPHVHFHLTVGANTSKDDFYTGSIKGALGGVTTYIDFLDPVKTTRELKIAYESRRELAKLSVTDYSFHTTIANPIEEANKIMKESMNYNLPSIKLFTTYSNTDRRTYDNYIDALLKDSKEYGLRVVIHAENDTMLWNQDSILVCDHERSRPAISETTEIAKLAEIVKQRDGLLYLVHISAGSSARLIKEHYKEQLLQGNILMESCPHYFLYNSEVYDNQDGYLYTMTPPLREEKERKLLENYIDDFSIIATDHCPFDAPLKKKEYTNKIPMGIGGIQYSFPLMFTEFGKKIIEKYTIGPAKAYGLYPKKGHLMPGADADIVIYDDSEVNTINEEGSIYHGREVKGKVEDVYLRGNRIVEKGNYLKSNGMFLERNRVL
jgi:dihydropyrimidinase